MELPDPRRPPARKTGHTTKSCLQKEKQSFIAWADVAQTSSLHNTAASCQSLF